MGENHKIAENETILYEHFDSSIIITDKRIRRKHSLSKDSPTYTSMILKDITSIDVRNDNKPWVLAVAIIAGVVGFSGLLEFQAWGLGGLFVSAVLVIYFFGSRQHIIEFRRPEGAIKFPTKYLTDREIMDLVDKIERSKIGSMMQNEQNK